MARGQIIVDTSQLDTAAGKVHSEATTYETTYNNLFKAVQELQNSWSGADNTAFTQQIEGFRDDFVRMKKLMDDYGDYLTKCANTYRETQSNVKAGVSSLSQGS